MHARTSLPLPPQIAAENGYTPVVATIATDDQGQALNINADTAAGEVCGPVPVPVTAKAF
jgi:hypothetical protein